MRTLRSLTSGLNLALLVTGCLLTPAVMRAQESGGERVMKMLTEARAEAVQLRNDCDELMAITRSSKAWQTYAGKIERIKEHVNAAGKLLTDMREAEAAADRWQKSAMGQIEPLIEELAANTERTIKHLNENQSRVHMPEMKDLAKANLVLARDLETLIRDYVDYGNAKETYERLAGKLKVVD
jgi:hypothetical protein